MFITDQIKTKVKEKHSNLNDYSKTIDENPKNENISQQDLYFDLQQQDLLEFSVINNDENDEYLDYLLSSFNQSYEEFLNNLYENDKIFENSQQLKRKLGGFHACRLKLSNDQSDFKANFYQIFTNQKRFSKELVKEIHEYMRNNGFNFKRMTRAQFRCIDQYFHDYSIYSEHILVFLKNNKKSILEKVTGLSNLK